MAHDTKDPSEDAVADEIAIALSGMSDGEFYAHDAGLRNHYRLQALRILSRLAAKGLRVAVQEHDKEIGR